MYTTQGQFNPYQAPQQHPATTPVAPQRYEFEADENIVVGDAARWTMVLAVMTFLQAAGNLASLNLLGAPLNALLGVFLVLSSVAFKKVVRTQGNDVAHFMSALRSFGHMLMVRIVVFILLVGLGLLAAAIALSSLHR